MISTQDLEEIVKPFIGNYISEAAITALEEAIKCVESEDELPGPMPDIAWGMVKDNRANCEESHRIAVRLTKRNCIDRIKKRIEAVRSR